MTLEDRIVLAGIALVLAAGLALPFLPHLADTFGSLFAPQPEPVPPVPWARYSEFCGKPASHDEADLCQQWRSANAAAEMSWYAFASLFIGALSIVGLFITLWLTRKATLKASEATSAAIRSAEAAERAYLIENRPWMDVDMELLPPIRVDSVGKIRAGFAVKATNVSNVPATRVQVFVRAFSSGPLLLPAPDALDWLPPDGVFAGYSTVVFPGREASMAFLARAAETSPGSISREAEFRASNPTASPPRYLSLCVRYGVRYGSTATDDRYHTAYTVWLYPKGQDGFSLDSTLQVEDIGTTPLANHSSLV